MNSRENEDNCINVSCGDEGCALEHVVLWFGPLFIIISIS